MALFQKPKLDKKEYFANLEKEIFRVTEELEKAKTHFADAYVELDKEFSAKKALKEKELASLENTLMFLRSERAELEKPIEHKREELNQRESELKKREIEVLSESQKAYEREREAEKKLESVQELADELGETAIRHMVKEKLLNGREESIKSKEAQYLLKVEKFSHEVNESAARIQERENDLIVREANLDGKEENMVTREKELKAGYVLLNDRRTLLEKGWTELREKQHGKSDTASIATKKRP